jgi:hypothetical protein
MPSMVSNASASAATKHIWFSATRWVRATAASRRDLAKAACRAFYDYAEWPPEVTRAARFDRCDHRSYSELSAARSGISGKKSDMQIATSP